MKELGVVQSEIVKQEIYPFSLISFLLDSPNEVYLTSSNRDITYNGVLYKASGNLVSISPVKETKTLKRPNMSFTVSGVGQELMALALTQKFGNRIITLDRGFIGEDDLVVGGDSGIKRMYSGRVHSFKVSEDPEGTSTLDWITTSIWGDFERSAGRRTNEADQSAYLTITKQDNNYPSDRAFEHTFKSFPDIQWGRD